MLAGPIALFVRLALPGWFARRLRNRIAVGVAEAFFCRAVSMKMALVVQTEQTAPANADDLPTHRRAPARPYHVSQTRTGACASRPSFRRHCGWYRDLRADALENSTES